MANTVRSISPMVLMPCCTFSMPSRRIVIIPSFNAWLLISTALLPPECRERCGYWGTEHLGSWIVLFPSHVMHGYNAPASIGSWLQNVFSHDTQAGDSTALAGVHFLVPLSQLAKGDPLAWLRTAVRSLGRRIAPGWT